MKVHLEMEIDLNTGVYDVRFHNLDAPEEDIDMDRLQGVVARVLDNVASKTAHDKNVRAGWRHDEAN